MSLKFLSRSTLIAAAAVGLSACKTGPVLEDGFPSVVNASYSKPHFGSLGARNCLMRAMYFESIRSSREGLLAVGTVVMNRVESPKFPSSVCGVVGQRRQFAPGVLRRKMRGNQEELAELADAILAGKRHPGVKRAKFFHQAGLSFPYKNMHYVLEAGGNAFYEKRSRKKRRRRRRT
ncbi:MAG: cell wall hydrolase [Alphaproteobacteria bacterium]|nr:cell wall hydrolase [Alphaproteobacteria bacterium]